MAGIMNARMTTAQERAAGTIFTPFAILRSQPEPTNPILPPQIGGVNLGVPRHTGTSSLVQNPV